MPDGNIALSDTASGSGIVQWRYDLGGGSVGVDTTTGTGNSAAPGQMAGEWVLADTASGTGTGSDTDKRLARDEAPN